MMNTPAKAKRPLEVPPSEPSARRPSGRAWPLGIVGGLGLVVIANAVMINFAFRNPSVPASEDHWQEGIEHDTRMAQWEHARELNWEVNAEVCPPPASADRASCAFELAVKGPNGEALDDLEIEVDGERADSASHDHQWKLHALGSGRYRANWDERIGRGLYRLRIHIQGSQPDENTERARWVGERLLLFPGIMPGVMPGVAK